MKVDIRKYPELISIINDELSSGNIIELKNEPRGVTLVRIDRKVKARCETKGER